MSHSQLKHLPEVSYAAPQLASKREHLVRASENLWRVHETATSRLLGHLRIAPDPLGLRYRAERLHLPTGAFRLIGDFWRADDAIQALRNG